MGETVYNKLVRDKIPEIIDADGAIPTTRVLSEEEFKGVLLDKLDEEKFEYAAAQGDERLSELADMQEVLDALTKAAGYTLAQREIEQKNKTKERGGFEKRIFLESVVSKIDAQQTTLKTYDTSAQALAEYFRGIGSREDDIDRAIGLLDDPSGIKVFEIGCGDGRDGVAITKRVGTYKGIDYSEGMIAVAKEANPEIDFSVGDMLNTEYPKDQDIIFAFASLLHLNKEELGQVLKKCYESLADNGILYISLKEKPEYCSEWKIDKYGERLFYFYNLDLLTEIAGSNYQELYRSSQTISATDWFTLALRKVKS